MPLKRYRYRPYSSKRKNKTRRRVFSTIILIIAVILFMIINKSCSKQELITEPVSLKTVEIQDTKVKPPSAPQQQRGKMTIPTTAAKKVEPEVKTVAVAKEPVKPIELPAKQGITIAKATEDSKLQEVESQTRKFIENKKYIEARDLLNDTLKLPLTAQQRSDIKNSLASLSKLWLFSSEVLPNDTICMYHKVMPGQSLGIIGEKYDMPWEFIQKINNIDKPENLRAGAKIKVVNGPFHLRIFRSTFTMDMFVAGKYVKSYKVGLGKLGQQGNPTPTGMWRVKSSRDGGKLKRPPWPEPITGKYIYYGDPEYPLGERWVGLDGIDGEAKGRHGFGIHGTNQPKSIGQYASDGCIRLLNQEVIELWEMVSTARTTVEVLD